MSILPTIFGGGPNGTDDEAKKPEIVEERILDPIQIVKIKPTGLPKSMMPKFVQYTEKEVEGSFSSLMQYRLVPTATRAMGAVDYDQRNGEIELEYSTEEEKAALPDITFMTAGKYLLEGFAPEERTWFTFLDGGLVMHADALYYEVKIRNASVRDALSERAQVGSVWIPLMKILEHSGDEFRYVRPDLDLLNEDKDTDSIAKQVDNQRADAIKKTKAMLFHIRRSIDRMLSDYENRKEGADRNVFFGDKLVPWSERAWWIPAKQMPPNLRPATEAETKAGFGNFVLDDIEE